MPGVSSSPSLGVAGALTGGFIGPRPGFGAVTGFDWHRLAIAVLGALVVLTAYQLLG